MMDDPDHIFDDWDHVNERSMTIVGVNVHICTQTLELNSGFTCHDDLLVNAFTDC